MLGVVMYWTALVIQPTFDLVEQNAGVLQQGEERAQQAEKNVALLLENQNNNTLRLEQLLSQQDNLEANQTLIIAQIQSATVKLGTILDYFRNNFNETFLEGESLDRERTLQILRNVTLITEALIENLSSTANTTNTNTSR